MEFSVGYLVTISTADNLPLVTIVNRTSISGHVEYHLGFGKQEGLHVHVISHRLLELLPSITHRDFSNLHRENIAITSLC